MPRTLAEETSMSGRPLLCELHAHSTWSDGELSIRELVDLYGANGFDVLCITDHVGRSDAKWHDPRWRITGAAAFSDYLGEIEQEAWRADAEFGLLVVPGLELTYDDEDASLAAHAVAIGLRTLVSLDGGLESALRAARAAGSALIAAHPYLPDDAAATTRGTARWAVAGHALSSLVDRYELINRREIFPWVAGAGLPGVAGGDFHRPEHLRTWKTLLCCPPSEWSVVTCLRSTKPAYLVDFAEPVVLEAAA
jgi:predicted metal-dependent phosphoesterase TrpH